MAEARYERVASAAVATDGGGGRDATTATAAEERRDYNTSRSAGDAAERYLDEDDDDYDEDDDDDEDCDEKTSAEIRSHDLETLTAEEEADRLLASGRARPGAASSGSSREGGERRIRRARRKGRWRTRKTALTEDEREGELLYKVEEGPREPSSDGSVDSVDSRDMGAGRGRLGAARKKTKTGGFCRFAIIVFWIVAFLGLVYGAYRATHSRAQPEASQRASLARVRSNGTHEFAPTTILISLDGFRADFLHRGLTPALSSFVAQGVSPKYMNPSFPSLTFPNHFTLVTGLHPESHGIVGNSFWDPKMQKDFYYIDPAKGLNPDFWNAEPVWETAELQGLRTAIHMWPGSEAHIGTLEPAYVDKFNGDEELGNKVNRILGWLDIPGPNDEGASEATPRPQLIAAYVPNVDADGHKYGPNSTYIRSTIAEVDGMLGTLFRGLEDRNLTDVVNVIIVSDHGMATTSAQRLIRLDQMINTSLIEHTDGWPLQGLRPYDSSPAHVEHLHQQLLTASRQPKYAGAFSVYLRDSTMPQRFHFSANPRIAPLWIVPAPGWAVVDYELPAGEVYHPRGLHGYDHEHPLMRAVFLARGPAFPHPPGSEVAPFQNTEVYNLVCDSLGIMPSPGNGSLRLPLQPLGSHDFDTPPAEQGLLLDGHDWPSDEGELDLTGLLLPPPDVATLGGLPPVGEDGADEEKQQQPSKSGEEASRSWPGWLHGRLGAAKAWAFGLFGGEGERR